MPYIISDSPIKLISIRESGSQDSIGISWVYGILRNAGHGMDYS